MDPRLLAIFSNVPPKPDYDPVRKSIESSKDRPEVAAALKLFSSMPSSTADRPDQRFRTTRRTALRNDRNSRVPGLWLDDGCPRTTAAADHPSGDSTRSRYRARGPDGPYRSGNHIVGSQPPDRGKRFLREQTQPITTWG